MILLFILASLDKNSSLRNSLRDFLGFYKENRELLAMLAQSVRQEGAPQAEQPAPPAEDKKKSRPQGTDSLDLLDEYLKRCAV